MKILILYASAGAGHERAAGALTKAFKMQRRNADVLTLDILDFMPPLFRKTYAEGYLYLVRKAPELWGYLYSQTDKKAQISWGKRVRAAFNKMNAANFLRLYRDWDPDVAVCTHNMPLEVLSSQLKKRRIDTPLYCTITDFAAHGLWIVENVSCYYVATEEERRYLARRGQPESRISLTGIPIDPVFAEKGDRKMARGRLGLKPDLPAVLIVSGGYGVGSTVEVIRSFRRANVGCQLIAVAGANKRMWEEARAAAARLRIPITVLGYVNNVHELMDAADLVIGKSGGLTTSEALAKGKPMIITNPIPGQEQRNCEYLLESGAATRLYEIEDAPHTVKALLDDPARMARMRRNARRIGRPRAALDIVADIVRRQRAL